MVEGLEKRLNSLFQSRASIPFPDFAESESVFRKPFFCHQNVTKISFLNIQALSAMRCTLVVRAESGCQTHLD
jgi:hypothetical protein